MGSRFVLAPLLALVGFATARGAGAACTDTAAVAAVRAQIDLQCDCATAVSPSSYARCVKAVAAAAVDDGQLPSNCVSTAKRCASKSRCGRPGAVTCLRTTSRGTKCSIKKDAARCTKTGACVGAASSCCDAALGCAITVTTTTVAATTTTTVPAGCGDGIVGPGEDCDPPGSATCRSSAGGAFLECNADCTCPPVAGPTTTTVQTPTTTTSSTTSTTIPAPLVCTNPIIGLPPLANVPITIIAGSTNCGGVALNPPPAAPFSGEVDRANGSKISDLGTGCLYFGTGQNNQIPGGRLPDGAKLVVGVKGLSGLRVVLGPSAGTSSKDCTLPGGPGRHCLNGGAGTDGNGACTQDSQCGAGFAGRCALDANCFFGPPLPLPVPTNPGLSVCIVNAFDQGACGDMDLLARTATFSAGVSARAYLTGNATAPCPRCVAGHCDSGKNAGAACTAVGSAGTSIDCRPDDALFSGAIPVVLQGGSTEPTELSAADGKLCPGQGVTGAFGQTDATRILTRGMRLNPLGLLSSQALLTVAAPFCVASTGSVVIDSTVGLPGPGVFSVPTRLELGDLLGLLGLPFLP